MKRVWCLYRVSTKKQVNTDDDIPMQKNACHEFVNKQVGWRVTNELFEKGVSGWSKKADERDEINLILAAASKKEFDVLLVFMFDRLGRREDETPFIVNILNKQGIEVWSANEGQRKTESHTDKLLNYISFWQSDGESRKTSVRVKEAKRQLSEQGYFQGGVAPIGYKIIETDQTHWKNKDVKVKELAIHEEEGQLIQLIFDFYVQKHMGYRKIVDYLNQNGYRNRDGKVFGVSTIKRILSNPIYIGLKRYESAENGIQPYNDKLRLVTDELFSQAEQIRNIRNNKIKKQDKTAIPRAGKLMFSGLAYCKYCGSKLSGNYMYRDQKRYDKEGSYKNIIYRYKCPLNKGKSDCEHQQNIWGAKKYDTIILTKIKEIIGQLDLASFIDSSVKQKKLGIDQKQSNISNLQKEALALEKQLEKLNGEIVKSLMGESDFTSQQLSKAISGIEEQLQMKLEQLDNLKIEVERAQESHSDVNSIANELEQWEDKFDEADNDLKKAMLSRIVNKVYLAKDEVDIELNLMLSEFFQQKYDESLEA